MIGYGQHPGDFGRPKDDRRCMGAPTWEAIDIRNEATWLGTLTIETKVAHDTLAIAPRVCRKMTL
jgi:hypothetical protein